MRSYDVVKRLLPTVRQAVALVARSLHQNFDSNRPTDSDASTSYEAAITVTMRLLYLLIAQEKGVLSPDMQNGRNDSSPAILPCFHYLNRRSQQRIEVSDDALFSAFNCLQRTARRSDDHSIGVDSSSVELLGQIYETLLDYTATRKRNATADGQSGRIHIVRKTARRRDGAHYTPRCLAESTVEYALNPLVYDGASEGRARPTWKLRHPDEILDLKICDISCGSGAFLIQVCRYLAERLVEASNATGKIALQEARQLVAERCLYGVDKDPRAVEITKQSLLLLSESHGIASAILDRNIRHGDSLIDGRSNEIDVDRPFDWQREFSEVFADGGGFDAIVGNPPYISLYARESQSANFADRFDAYAKMHLGHIDGAPVLSGRINTYLLFLVRSLQLLNPTRGTAALVLPDTILTNRSYAPMRRALTENGRLICAIRYHEPMFRGASVGTAVVVCGVPSNAPRVTLIDQPRNGGTASVARERRTEILQRPSCSWLPQQTSHISRVTLPVSGTVPIGDFAYVKDGINPGSKQTRQWLLTEKPDGDPSLRLCMEGNWITPFRITKKPLWVRYDASRLTFEERKAGASLREQWIFESPKIVYRQTAPHITAAVDLDGLCVRNSVHCIVLKEHNEIVLHALTAFLNSEVCRDYYQSYTGETRKTFPQVHIASVKQLRVPEQILDASHRDTKRLARLASSISSTSDDIRFPPARPNADAMKPLNDLVRRMVANLVPDAKRKSRSVSPHVGARVVA